MQKRKSYTQVLAEAIAAFKDVERSYYEKKKVEKAKYQDFPKLKSIGFVNRTKEILVYR